MISGFYLYKDTAAIKDVWKKFLVRNYVPALLVAFMGILLKEWLFDRTGFFAAIGAVNWKEAFDSLFRGMVSLNVSYWGETAGHLWYILDYFQVLIMFPFIWTLVQGASDKVILYAIAFSVFRGIVVDINQFYHFPMEVYAPSFFITAQVYVLTGHLLYKNRAALQKRKCMISLFCIYAALLGVMFLTEQEHLVKTGANDLTGMYFSTLNSGIGHILTVVVSALFLTIPDESMGKRAKPWIVGMGKLTFPIYLIHFAIIMKLRSTGFERLFTSGADHSVEIALYYFGYTILIFVFSAFLSFVLGKFIQIIKRPLQKNNS